MPRGDKTSYTGKQKRMAGHIEEGYEKRGVSKDESERRAWATVNKTSGGGLKKKSAPKKKSAAKKTASRKTALNKRAPAKKAARKSARRKSR